MFLGVKTSTNSFFVIKCQLHVLPYEVQEEVFSFAKKERNPPN